MTGSNRKRVDLPEWAKAWVALMDKEDLESLRLMSEILFEIAQKEEIKAMTGGQAVISIATGLRASAEIGLQSAARGNIWEEFGKLLAKCTELNGGEPVLPNPGGKLL